MKRLFDLILSVTAIVLLTPIILIIAFVIFLKIGRPVIFIQGRTGLNEKPFQILKFRTMLTILDKNNELVSDKFRITSFGLFLRATSLDELPSLWNVVKGEMSIVGPRPLLIEYLPLYNHAQRKRHSVKPGLTGWAQINGRNNITWEQRFKLDIWYVENQTLILDLKIIWKTFNKVFNREGALANEEVTMPKFEGNHEPK